MEAEKRKTETVSGSVAAPDDSPVVDGWVAPEIEAAENGETVDFSKHVTEEDQSEDIDA